MQKGQRGQDVINIYKILHEYKNKGRLKSVGVSNFGIKHLQTLEKLYPHLSLPSVNQIEVHCLLYEKELINYCLEKGIRIEAYCPLARHHETAVNCKLLKELSDKYNKTYAQIMIKYLQQSEFIVITKTVRLNRLIENGNIFDFKMYQSNSYINGRQIEMISIPLLFCRMVVGKGLRTNTNGVCLNKGMQPIELVLLN